MVEVAFLDWDSIEADNWASQDGNPYTHVASRFFGHAIFWGVVGGVECIFMSSGGWTQLIHNQTRVDEG